ncbi:hypothetical protein D7X55_21900 [Corallococcus sp. AB049A]|uniref:Uncharacterized protein n=1 Tax=Corallococcus interemptor TaxID=2316720 RepID=A0A3A8QTG8_9BACT|nr:MULTISPECIES: hypothetical protein [Corallococcus]RKH51864.1 hypothetical protein D7Y23_08655 [Corallococcus sp. AB050B]RKH71048.1 hypothetical protein D7X96_09715 [Corallococcus interemptor]RKI62549.1 hypothetical protein D7X55_21900 [Corallococcus sp. AB049A]
MYLVITFLEQVEATERAIRRLREFGIPEPLVIRARSAAAALSAEVPVFAGLRSLALGADEDRVVLVSVLPALPQEEMDRILQRVQLEMDADDPPMGRLVALPVMAAPTHRR